jgi:O-antigen ligase
MKDTFTLVIFSQLALLTVGVLGFFVMPDLFGPFESRPGFLSLRTLAPPYMHSNAVSSVSALIATYATARFLQSGSGRRQWGAAMVIALFGLVLSSGRQGVAMALVGLGLVLWVERRRLLAYFVGPALIVAFLTYREDIIDALSRGRPNNWITLTGRLPWWEAAVAAWQHHPWTGWGFSTGGRFVALESIDASTVSSVHSGFLEVLVGVGIIGSIPFLYAVGGIVIWSWRQMASRTETAFAVLIFPLILRTAVGPGFGGWLNVDVVLFALLAALADRTRIELRDTTQIPGAPDPELRPVS